MKLSSLRFRLSLYFIKQSTLASILKDEDEILAQCGHTKVHLLKNTSAMWAWCCVLNVEKNCFRQVFYHRVGGEGVESPMPLVEVSSLYSMPCNDLENLVDEDTGGTTCKRFWKSRLMVALKNEDI